MISIAYIIFSVLVISFLIFIHELGHYFMAKRVGMRVETFSIGFGKPIISWQWGEERWQICWLIFGGYVKIHGMDEEPDRDPYDIPDGFFGKTPWDRIKVAAMGPITNILFALFIFSFIWVDGGREKNFTEFTHKIGWIDPQSQLYAAGVRPGDEITSYNDYPFQGATDHLYAPMISGGPVKIKGNRIDYQNGEHVPFEVDIQPYQHPQVFEKGRLTTGILSSASYIVYDRIPNNGDNPLIEGSPLQDSGIQYGDRIVWVDGERIFSVQQLNQIINDGRALVTVQRGDEILLRRVPRVTINELKLNNETREELTDWQFEAGLNDEKLRNVYMIPYDVTPGLLVQGRIRMLDNDSEKAAFPESPFSELEQPLKPGDKIIAIDALPVAYAYEALRQLQTNRINIIVERDRKSLDKISWLDADRDFDQQLDWQQIQKIAANLGTQHPVTQSGDFILLKTITPKMLTEFNLPPEKQALLTQEIENRRKQIEAIEDPDKKAQAMLALQDQEKKLLIGLPNIQDRKVEYNPIPTDLFYNVFNEITRTLSALFTGSLSPKWISGPVGIVQVVHDRSMISIKESLFWIGAISLNLGILNLLPIPMLDGGTIVFNIFEIITGRRLHPKLLERLIIPFAILLFAFFIFLTYNDLARLFGGIWRF